jgi:hypothetical protein
VNWKLIIFLSVTGAFILEVNWEIRLVELVADAMSPLYSCGTELSSEPRKCDSGSLESPAHLQASSVLSF